MKRNIYTELLKWKNDHSRKVLLLRGARQVGKTYIVRELGREFRYLLEVNFESDKAVCSFFEQDLNIQRICTDLSAYFGVPINEGETLLFLDEIQACRNAIESLRFFYEKKPGLHVIAAGSLLEFAFQKMPSYGVGRIHSLFMYPLSFDEFLTAMDENQLIEIKKNASSANPVNKVFHNKLKEYLKKFLITGGMPEALKSYVENRDLLKVQQVQEDLIISLQDDFSKYKDRAPVARMKEIFESIARQSGSKFVLSRAIERTSTPLIRDALELLSMAGISYPVYHTSSRGLPLGAQINPKKFKVLLYDTGIVQRSLKLPLSDYLLADNLSLVNKGQIAEVFVGLELLKYHKSHEQAQLFYWHREERASHAEVDYIIVINGMICPLEVKSGTSGKMQSIKIFLKERNLSMGIRTSLENFSSYQNIEILPLYAISNLLNR